MADEPTHGERIREAAAAVVDALMSGRAKDVAALLAPHVKFTNRDNAGARDAPWYDRLEGEYRLQGPEEIAGFVKALMDKATYLSYELRGLLAEGDEAACTCDWTRILERDGTVLTGTTMFWLAFTTDGRVRSIETIGSIHSVIPSRRSAEAEFGSSEPPRVEALGRL